MGQISTWRKRAVTRTESEAEALKHKLLLAIRRTGSTQLALERLSISSEELDFWQSTDPEFSDQIKVHLDLADLDVLNKVRERAMEGTEKPILHQGAIVYLRVPPEPPREDYDPDDNVSAYVWTEYKGRLTRPDLWPLKERPEGEEHPEWGIYYPLMERVYDNQLLLRLASQIDPSLNPSSQVHLSGHVRHTSTRQQDHNTGKLPPMDRANRQKLRQALLTAMNRSDDDMPQIVEDANFTIIEDPGNDDFLD